MHISEAKEFIASALNSDNLEFDENGVCQLTGDTGIGIFLEFASPELRTYCTPFSESEFEEIVDQVPLLESLLAINYESDIGSRQAFKMAFQDALGVPVIVADFVIDDLKAEVLRETYDELRTIANIVREIIMEDDFLEENEESTDAAEADPTAAEDGTLWL